MAKSNTAAVAKAAPAPKASEQPTMPDLSGFKTKSAQIRHLADLGWTRGQIAKGLDIRYQHVRNVLVQPLKRGPQEG